MVCKSPNHLLKRILNFCNFMNYPFMSCRARVMLELIHLTEYFLLSFFTHSQLCLPPSRVITENDLMNARSKGGFRCWCLHGSIEKQRKQLAVISTNLCSTPGQICTWSSLQFESNCIKICFSGNWNICSVEYRSLRHWLWCTCKYFCLNTPYSSWNLGRWQYQYRSSAISIM